MKDMKISFVIPCYRSEHTLPAVIAEIEATMAQRPQLDYEIICVSDASPDGVYGVIADMAQKDRHIRGAEFMKNFGQHAALMAGYRMVTGDVVVSVDDDGQIPVDETFKLVDKLDEGYDIVWGTYTHKQHSAFRNFGTWVNKLMAEHLIEQPKDLQITSFSAMTRQVVDAIAAYKQPYIYISGLQLRVTRKLGMVPVQHRQRQAGTSGYNFQKLLSLWLNGFTAFSVKPLRVASLLGVASAMLSFVYLLYIVVKHYLAPGAPMGWSSLIASIFLVGGILMMMLGMIGEYIGRMYICINEAPQYVLRRTTGENARE